MVVIRDWFQIEIKIKSFYSRNIFSYFICVFSSPYTLFHYNNFESDKIKIYGSRFAISDKFRYTLRIQIKLLQKEIYFFIDNYLHCNKT